MKKDWREVWPQPIATVLAVAVAAAGIYFTDRSNNDTEHNREKTQFALAAAQQRNAFVLAAAQVVMSQPTCKLEQARARQLVRVFPTLKSPFSKLTKHRLSAGLCKQLRERTSGGGGGFPFIPGLFPFFP